MSGSRLWWKRWCWPRRGGGGGAREEREGEAAREEARDDATMALARESIAAFEGAEGEEEDARRRLF
jgi:hypothetical protein